MKTRLKISFFATIVLIILSGCINEATPPVITHYNHLSNVYNSGYRSEYIYEENYLLKAIYTYSDITLIGLPEYNDDDYPIQKRLLALIKMDFGMILFFINIMKNLSNLQ